MYNAKIFINISDSYVEVYWAEGESQNYLWLSFKRPPRKIPKTPIRENDFELFEKYGSH
ncbi:hypothetical protein [Desulfobacca acetoxidans]